MNLKDLYEASRLRVQKQRLLEDYICDMFQPDFMESAELVAAILGGLRMRYEDNLGADIEHCFKELMDLLNEADMTKQISRPDDNWTDMSHGSL